LCHPAAVTDVPTQAQAARPSRKNRRGGIWIALLSVFVFIFAAGVFAASVYLARQQNVAAQQQQLVSITTSIAVQFAGEQAAENQAALSLTGAKRSAAIASVAAGIATELTAEGQAGAVLIADLHGHGVAGVEYIEVAKALASGGYTAQAITYYADAVNAPPNAVQTRSAALRQEAVLLYSIGRAGVAHQDMMRAASIYTGHLELSHYNIDNAIAQTYLTDAGYQIPINCHAAMIDLMAARHAIAPLGPGGATAAVAALQSTDGTAYHNKCS
jgi:hypothetical protein